MTRRSHRKKRNADEIRQLPWRDVTNPYAPIEVISADQVETILQSAHQVLETQGFRFLDPGSRQRLACVSSTIAASGAPGGTAPNADFFVATADEIEDLVHTQFR